jgi:hypothetical protein
MMAGPRECGHPSLAKQNDPSRQPGCGNAVAADQCHRRKKARLTDTGEAIVKDAVT